MHSDSFTSFECIDTIIQLKEESIHTQAVMKLPGVYFHKLHHQLNTKLTTQVSHFLLSIFHKLHHQMNTKLTTQVSLFLLSIFQKIPYELNTNLSIQVSLSLFVYIAL